MFEDLTCMISQELFVFPVAMPCCGISFSKKYILEWVKRTNNCPNCSAKNKYDIKLFKKNLAIDNMVERYIGDNPTLLTEEQKNQRELEKKFISDFELNLIKEQEEIKIEKQRQREIQRQRQQEEIEREREIERRHEQEEIERQELYRCNLFNDTLIDFNNEGLKNCRKIKILDVKLNPKITTCEPFKDTLINLLDQPWNKDNEGLKNCQKIRFI